MFDETAADDALSRLSTAVDDLLALMLPLAADEFVLHLVRTVQIR